MADVVSATGALPARSFQACPTTKALVASSTSAVGVKIAEKENVPLPLSTLAPSGPQLPLGAVTSARVKLATSSLKVNVTVATSPIFRALSLLAIVTVGGVVSAAAAVVKSSVNALAMPA